MNKKLIYTTLLLTFSLLVTAQSKIWSLQECIDTALEQSLEEQVRQLEVKRAERSKTSLIHYWLPTVNLAGNHSYNFGSTIDPATNGRVSSNILYDNFYLNASVNVLDFNNLALKSKSKLELEKAEAERKVFENEYKLQIAESYYQALYTQELVKIKSEQLKNSKNNLDRVLKEVEIGSKPKSDEYDMQLSYKSEQAQLVDSEQQLVLLKLQLFQLINKTDVEVQEIVLEDFSSGTIDKEIQNPKLDLAETNFKISKKTILQYRANSLPSLSAYYQFSTFYYKPLNQPDVAVSDLQTQLQDNKNHQIGLQLNIPIFNGFRNSKQIASAKIETEKSKVQMTFEKQQLEKQLALENERKEQYKQLESRFSDVLDFAKLSYRTSQSKFESGKIEAVTFNSVKNQLLQSQYDVLKNQLMIRFTTIKMNLLKYNEL
ncbi:TolC family protein [Flavobacterium sp. NRK F10]|uniref:TolC family protein n=1 Tax=Flavobacterium sp. NRK F10 TaxID=2954931 RepID=UPI002090A0F2|nr:TolC family protein [Flavobacterium sp. NRK F10]MCO6175032.1 TolC family protein [Flavobacterium sp. NRK F10]